MSPFHFCLSAAKNLSSFQLFLGLPLFLFPWGFQSRAAFGISPSSFLNVWPIHLNFLFHISKFISSCPVTFHRSLLEIIFGHHILNIYLRHLFTKVCILHWPDACRPLYKQSHCAPLFLKFSLWGWGQRWGWGGVNHSSPTALIRARIDFAWVFMTTLGSNLPELIQKYPWECCSQKYGFHSPQFLQMPDTELPYTETLFPGPISAIVWYHHETSFVNRNVFKWNL